MPFSQRSGVLEWCSGTVPIGQFLVDPDHGAHKRFRPQDWTNFNCRRKMAVELLLPHRLLKPICVLQFCCHSSQVANQGFDEKLQAYSEVCKNFRPVFRYFCMERFLDPAVWMEKRLAYTRSVATSSIGTERNTGQISQNIFQAFKTFWKVKSGKHFCSCIYTRVSVGVFCQKQMVEL